MRKVWKVQKIFISNRLFIKILLCFLSLLIPIVIIGSIVYNDVTQLTEHEVTEKLTNNLQSSIQTIDLHMSMAHSTTNNLLQSDIIQQNLRLYSNMTEAQKVNMQLIVRAVGAKQNTFSSFIDHIFLYIDKEKVYTGDGVINFPLYFNKFFRSDDYGETYWSEQLLKTDFYKLLPHTVVYNYSNVGKDVIPSVTTRYINGSLATLVTTLSLKAIETNLTSHSIYDSTKYVVFDQYGQAIINRTYFNMIQKSGVELNSSSQSTFVSIDNKTYLVIQTQSEHFAWNYYSITPIDAFSHESKQILTLILLICIALILIGIVLSVVFSVYLYNPIRNIHNILLKSEGKQNGLIERNANDEFKAIRNRIYQLLKKNNEVVSQLNQYSNELLDHFFVSLINGIPIARIGSTKQMLNSINFTDGQYLSCCFMFQYKDRFSNEIQKPERVLIQEKMKNVLWGIMQQYVTCYTLKHEEHFYVSFVQLQSQKDRLLLNEALENIKTTFSYDLVYCELTIGLGKVYDSIQDLGKSYSDALTVINRIDGNSSIQIIDAIDITIEGNYFYSFTDQNRLVNLMRAGHKEQIEIGVKELIASNLSRNVAFSHLGSLMAELMNTGIRYLNEKQLNREQLLSLEEEKIISEKQLLHNELDARVERLLEFYYRIIDAADAGKIESKKTETIVMLVMDYIEQHYTKELYLELIAEEVGLSAKYISRIFKNHSGITIPDYINDLRMTQAKKLLTQTDMKVVDIAEMVGINNRTTFLRMFRKYEGISPTDYRTANLLRET